MNTPAWWNLFVQAPEAVAILVATTAGIVWLVVREIYSNRIEALKEQLTARDGEISRAKEQLTTASNVVSELRAKQEALPGATKRAPIHAMSNAEIAKRTFELATAARRIQLQYSKSFFTTLPPASTEADRVAAHNAEQRMYEANRNEVQRQYGLIRGEILAVLAELKDRVSPEVLIRRSPNHDLSYEFQAGPTPFHEIADDLEGLALALET